MSGAPLVNFVIPLYNAADMLPRSVRSALRQRGVDVRVLVVDHGSTDGSDRIAAELAEDPRVEVITLVRRPDDRRTPARPLNVGLAHAARTSEPPDRSWTFRLDADDFLADDDVAAEQLALGGYRKLVTATALFFNEEERYAYVYGPAPHDRTLERYRKRGAYSAAHPSNAVRTDLLREVLTRRASLMDQDLDFGEDLDQTCLLLSAVGPGEFAVVDRPYCFKAIGSHTATAAASTRHLWTSHMRLHRRNPDLSRFTLLRGFAELVLGDLVGEQRARRVLQRFAGRNGDFRECDYGLATKRLAELAAPV
ncbi:glycosyltransferase family 2 protein [Saccharothrix obliqua]|uniref:glycosyltransferase family 2 protein n=1 Tax=Saccharothrix obliqua TaxID=2861747 RepID=UPI001C5D2D1A|nr:glycosyltransferase family 2 protein [Saccharothrix obliqua]MBW4720409.1 glycosyltransferase family 2 protein [Saccharothrix obliqua]